MRDAAANRKMKKILIITAVGGFLPQFEMNDVRLLLQQGYEIHYASNFQNPVYELDSKALEAEGIRLHPVAIRKSPVRGLSNLKALFQIRAVLKREGIRAIHCHNPMGGVLGRIASFGLAGEQKPYVLYTAHGFHFYRGAPLLNWILYFPIERLLAGYTDCLITINHEDAERAGKWKGGRLRTIRRIPGVGVDTRRFEAPEKERRKARERLGMGEEVFHLLSVGELNRNKNHEVILRSIALLGDPDIRYGICGKGYRRAYLEKLAKKLGIAGQVTFYGFRYDIPAMLWSADLFLFPSIREGLGIAALEAMAAGVPLITSDCRGTREYMEDGVTGYVCRSGKPREYAELIRRMKESPRQARAMSAACRERAAAFDLSRTERIMREIYGAIPPFP